MIQLSRISGKVFYLNSDLIEYIESTPDTVITLVGGKTVMVQEDIKTVIDRIIEYKRSLNMPKIKSNEKDCQNE